MSSRYVKDHIVAQHLDYQRAIVVFRSEFRYRSGQGVAAGVCAVFVIFFGVMFYQFASLPAGRGIGVACIVIGAAGATAQTVYIGLNRRRQFEVRSDGIWLAGRLHHWSDIRQFAAYGSPDVGCIQLFFKTRASPLPHYLMTNRAISRPQYEGIIAALRSAIGQIYPQVQLGGYESDG